MAADMPTTTETTGGDDHDDAVEQMSIDEAMHAAEAIEANGRAWLKTLTPLLQTLVTESWSGDETVQHYLNQLTIAAATRAARICRADMIG